MKDKEMTTIKIPKDFLKQLKEYKVHPRESYTDVIKRAIKGELYPSDPNETEGDASKLKEETTYY